MPDEMTPHDLEMARRAEAAANEHGHALLDWVRVIGKRDGTRWMAACCQCSSKAYIGKSTLPYGTAVYLPCRVPQVRPLPRE